MMCDYKGVELGSYANQIEVNRPKHMIGRCEGTSSHTIYIDSCILEEIQELWKMGIITTGCCCGHNVLPAFVGVVEADIPKMKVLGYTVQFNSCRPTAEDTFNIKIND